MHSSQSRVLVTGASGFVGQVLCAKLLSEGYDLKAVVRKQSAKTDLFSKNTELESAVADLEDRESLNIACKDIDTVVHLAGIAHVNNISPSEYKKTIVAGSTNLFKACVQNKVNRIVFVSSALAEIAENDANKATAYGRAKLEAENRLEELCKNSETEFVILRPVNVYGPDMKGNITRMIRWVGSGLMPALPQLETRLSLLSVEDLVEFILRAIAQSTSRNQCYLLAEQEPYRLLDIEKEIYNCVGKNYPTRRSPHMLLYSAAALAGFLAKTLGLFGIQTPLSSISLRTYSNLVNDSVFDGSHAIDGLGFVPKGNLYNQLPAIIQAMKTE